MGLKDAFTRLFSTNQDAVSGGSANNPDPKLNNFSDHSYERIARTVTNARWAYENDTTVNSSINNAVITANSGIKLVADDPKYNAALEHIRLRARDWDLEDFIDECAIKFLVDGVVYIQKSIRDGKLYVNFLAYDGDKYDFKIIRDPETEEILGYKQKATVNRIDGNWESTDFDELEGEEEIVETNFLPEEIINMRYMERDGEGRSAIYPALDLVDMKKRIEEYMLKHAHKSGTILGVEIGADEYDISTLSDADIDKIIDWFREHDNKEVIGYPAGIKPHLLSTGVLLDFTLYLRYLKSEIRSVLMTPDSKFESSKGSRFTAKEQMSGSAGFVVYIDYLRSFIKSYLEPELIDEELDIAGFQDAIGHIHIEWEELDQDDEVDSSKIAERLKNIDPEADNEIIKKAYFKRYSELAENLPLNGGKESNDPTPTDPKPGEEEDENETRLTSTVDEDPIRRKLRERGWVGVTGRLK